MKHFRKVISLVLTVALCASMIAVGGISVSSVWDNTNWRNTANWRMENPEVKSIIENTSDKNGIVVTTDPTSPYGWSGRIMDMNYTVQKNDCIYTEVTIESAGNITISFSDGTNIGGPAAQNPLLKSAWVDGDGNCSSTGKKAALTDLSAYEGKTIKSVRLFTNNKKSITLSAFEIKKCAPYLATSNWVHSAGNQDAISMDYNIASNSIKLSGTSWGDYKYNFSYVVKKGDSIYCRIDKIGAGNIALEFSDGTKIGGNGTGYAGSGLKPNPLLSNAGVDLDGNCSKPGSFSTQLDLNDYVGKTIKCVILHRGDGDISINNFDIINNSLIITPQAWDSSTGDRVNLTYDETSKAAVVTPKPGNGWGGIELNYIKTVQPGSYLHIKTEIAVSGNISVVFADGTSIGGAATNSPLLNNAWVDGDGNCYSKGIHDCVVDLTPYAGKTIAKIRLHASSNNYSKLYDFTITSNPFDYSKSTQNWAHAAGETTLVFDDSTKSLKMTAGTGEVGYGNRNWNVNIPINKGDFFVLDFGIEISGNFCMELNDGTLIGKSGAANSLLNDAMVDADGNVSAGRYRTVLDLSKYAGKSISRFNMHVAGRGSTSTLYNLMVSSLDNINKSSLNVFKAIDKSAQLRQGFFNYPGRNPATDADGDGWYDAYDFRYNYQLNSQQFDSILNNIVGITTELTFTFNGSERRLLVDTNTVYRTDDPGIHRYAVALIGIPKAAFNVDINAKTYIIFNDKDGSLKTIAYNISPKSIQQGIDADVAPKPMP